jgi:cbb3-type cytochrome oxidase subunit 3
MISKVLSDIGNVSIYPVATLIIFFGVFSGMLFIVLRARKDKYDEIARLPLDADEQPGYQEVHNGK